MQRAKENIFPLGDYITLCKRKNKNLESTKLVGISMYSGIIENARRFQESYLKTGWIAEKGDFVIDLVNIQHNSHFSVGINRSDELVVISHIYNVFRVTNSNLLSEYLLLLFKNSTVEKWLKWACHGSVRGTLSWENFTKLPILVPPLEIQRRIVNKYETLKRIIQLKKEINEKLERWMESLFHVLFDELKEYTNETFGNLFQIIRGGRPPRGNEIQEQKYFCKRGGIPWLQVSDITKKKYKFIGETIDQLTPEGFKKGRCTTLGGGISFSSIMLKNNKLKT